MCLRLKGSAGSRQARSCRRAASDHKRQHGRMSVTDPEASAEADSLQESESTALAKQGSHFDPAPAGQPKSGQCGRLLTARWMIRCVPTLTQGWVCSQEQTRNMRSKCRCSCVLQFTCRLAASCVLHRPPSQLIHCMAL